MTVVSDQMTDSMGGMIPIIVVFSVVLYMLLVYLLSKVIIEKNANSVSIVKYSAIRMEKSQDFILCQQRL